MPSDSRRRAERLSSGTSRRKVLKTTPLVALGGALAGCIGGDGDGGGGGGGGGEITVVTYRSSDAAKSVHQAYNKEFTDQTGINVNMVYTGFAEITERISTMIRGGNTPDVIMGSLDGTMGGPYQQDLLADLSEVADEVYDSSQRREVQDFCLHVDDTFYSLPSRVTFQNGLVRADLLEQVGHDPFGDSVYTLENPSYDELASWVQDVDQSSDVAGFGLGVDSGSRGGHETVQLLYSNGVEIFGGEPRKGELTLELDQGENREQAIESLEWLRDDIVPYADWGTDWGWGDLQAAYANEEIANLYYRWGRWAQMLGERGKPDIFEATKNYPAPQNNARSDNGLMRMATGQMAVLTNSNNTDGGKQWISNFIGSKYFFDNLYAVPMDALPPTSKHRNDERFLEYNLGDTPVPASVQEVVSDRREEMIKFYDGMIESGQQFSFVLNDPGGGFNPVYSNMLDEVYRLMQLVLVKDEDPADAVDSVGQLLRNDTLADYL